ncbi:hypothetical protein [Thauera sp.]|uniref:hypothetical protein n=1 Tax=Thauera sp. TaxID=1905334 RepID=UPI0039E3899C
MTDLFEDEFLAATAALVHEQHHKAHVQATRRASRRATRRAASTAALAEVFPQQLEPGTSWHFISQGDIDSLSYLTLLLDRALLDYLLFSTWCMALDDVAQIERWLLEGRIGRVDAYCGEIFPSQYPDEHVLLAEVLHAHGGRLAVFRNHSKIMAGYDAAGQGYVLESSANINTNPRAEQTALHIDTSLADFYRGFFDGIRSFERDFDHVQPWSPQQ